MQMPGQVKSAEERLASTVREARARVMWGEPKAEILEWMADAGVDESYAQQVVSAAMKERGAMVRAQGMKELIVGIVFLAVGIALFVLVLISAMISVPMLGGCGLFVAFGLFKFFRGLGRMLAGAGAKVDVADL